MQTPFPPDMNIVPYRDRASAGRWLAKQLEPHARQGNLVILGIPRGGVIVAAEVARVLQSPLDVFVVRKILLGGEQKRNIGAVASGGICVLNQDVLSTTETEAVEVAQEVSRVRDAVLQSEQVYRQGRPAFNVQGRTVVLVDDGAASGSSLRAAIAALKPQSPSSIIVAIPVASPEAAAHLAREANELICSCVPDPFFSIGLAYERFPRLSEDEVSQRMAEIDAELFSSASTDPGPYTDGARTD